MNDGMIRRLRHKIVLASLVAVFASLAVLIFAINYAHYRQVDWSLRTAMGELAGGLEVERKDQQKDGLWPRGNQNGANDESAGEEGTQGTTSPQADEARRMLQSGRKSANTQYASRFFCVLVDSDGNMVVRAKGTSELSDDGATELAQRVLASGKSEGYLDDYKYVVEELREQGKPGEPQAPDTQARVLFLDCTTDLQSLHQLLSVSLVVGGCAFLIASLFVLRFSRLAVRPLEESARKQKQFVADAGHELKTPLSVIATNMDILEVDLADRPEEQEWIDSTSRQVANMKRLVNDLIELSKMEGPKANLTLTDVSLTDIAYECVTTFDPLARAQGKRLVARIDEGACVRADEPSVRQLMQILIDNAVKYATGDGTVEIEVRREGPNAVFVTRNQWEHNVSPQELSSLFDRFVRGEQSRDRSRGNQGHGLGLSIARAVAQRNGAELDVSEDGDKIVFRVTFGRSLR